MSPPQRAPDRLEIAGLALVIAIGAAVRILHLAATSDLPFFRAPMVDERAYHEAAVAIASGDFTLAGTAAGPRAGYQYFLAAIYTLFGDGPWPIRIVQLALGLAIVVLLWDTTRRLFGARWALLPSATAAVFGPYVFYETTLLATTLATALHALLLWLTVTALQSDGAALRRWALVGFSWGLACIVRPNALLLIAPLGLAALGLLGGGRPTRERLLASLLLVAGGAFAIAPLAARNLLWAGEPVLITAHAGWNLYVGNGPEANGTCCMPIGGAKHRFENSRTVAHQLAERDLGRSLSAVEADRYWFQRTMAAVADDPLRTLHLAWTKFHLFWNGRDLGNVHDYSFNRLVNPVLGAPLVQHAWVLALGLAGTLVLLARPREYRFVALFNLTLCASLVLVFVVSRFRLPAMASILIAATATLYAAAAAISARRWGRLVALGVGVALAQQLATPVSNPTFYDEEYYKLGNSWYRQDRRDDALRAYRKALQINPDHIRSHYDLAVLYQKGGALKQSIAHWQQVATLAGPQGLPEFGQTAREQIRHLRGLQRPGGSALPSLLESPGQQGHTLQPSGRSSRQ